MPLLLNVGEESSSKEVVEDIRTMNNERIIIQKLPNDVMGMDVCNENGVSGGVVISWLHENSLFNNTNLNSGMILLSINGMLTSDAGKTNILCKALNEMITPCLTM